MANSLEEVERVAMELGDSDRLALAERLVASVPFDPAVQQAWIDEALRREARLLSGEDPGLTFYARR
ncbi:MAG TPA: addiction module protein [Thermoanaerobaculia bacterium]|nr:addiction module protein [Thermoanaerobaculia bacterium]